ncbi:Single-stranded DNA-binding protein [subsurface metagenome]
MANFQSLNSVILVGWVSSDVEFEQGKGKDEDVSIAKFSIATNEKFASPKLRTQFHNVIMWGQKKAEFCKNFIRKGQLIAITGKLKHQRWKDKEGNQRKTTQINIDEVIFLGKKGEYVEVPKKEGSTAESKKKKDPF